MAESHAPGRRPSGELEASVLAALWAADGRPLTPADVQRELVAGLGADLARTTVTTILARLHDKGAVSRTRSGRGFVYLPTQDPPGLTARRMRTELDKSSTSEREAALTRFVSELNPADEELLRTLLTRTTAPPRADTGTPPGSAPDPAAAPDAKPQSAEGSGGTGAEGTESSGDAGASGVSGAEGWGAR